ncbi:MAG: proline iminopeptidase-family hydrolase [Thermoleophilia bacterium]|nr:proline iminopeptidase-family hydrolase [Thermoleophilia bacterium]MBJ7333672.1 proline iminopeptidase-family hydrolase [Thermoleophilia bacterium]
MRTEGYLELSNGRVWWRREGAGDALPILLLHGGPGAASYYLEPFAERLALHRPVIIFDQLGCGRSDQPDDPKLWTLDRACQELDDVRAALGLEHCHLLGQSWGGWLAIEYLCRGTEGIERVVLASTSASMRQFGEESLRLIHALPPAICDTILKLSEARQYDDPAFVAASMEFYNRHVCRLDPWPEAMVLTADELDGNQVYLTMNGPNEFTLVGTLRDWDRSADLSRITQSTLITCGRYDEITPACSETILHGIPNGRMVVFEESAHCAHLEERELYTATVEEFLAA